MLLVLDQQEINGNPIKPDWSARPWDSKSQDLFLRLYSVIFIYLEMTYYNLENLSDFLLKLLQFPAVDSAFNLIMTYFGVDWFAPIKFQYTGILLWTQYNIFFIHFIIFILERLYWRYDVDAVLAITFWCMAFVVLEIRIPLFTMIFVANAYITWQIAINSNDGAVHVVWDIYSDLRLMLRRLKMHYMRSFLFMIPFVLIYDLLPGHFGDVCFVFFYVYAYCFGVCSFAGIYYFERAEALACEYALYFSESFLTDWWVHNNRPLRDLIEEFCVNSFFALGRAHLRILEFVAASRRRLVFFSALFFVFYAQCVATFKIRHELEDDFTPYGDAVLVRREMAALIERFERRGFGHKEWIQIDSRYFGRTSTQFGLFKFHFLCPHTRYRNEYVNIIKRLPRKHRLDLMSGKITSDNLHVFLGLMECRYTDLTATLTISPNQTLFFSILFPVAFLNTWISRFVPKEFVTIFLAPVTEELMKSYFPIYGAFYCVYECINYVENGHSLAPRLFCVYLHYVWWQCPLVLAIFLHMFNNAVGAYASLQLTCALIEEPLKLVKILEEWGYLDLIEMAMKFYNGQIKMTVFNVIRLTLRNISDDCSLEDVFKKIGLKDDLDFQSLFSSFKSSVGIATFETVVPLQESEVVLLDEPHPIFKLLMSRMPDYIRKSPSAFKIVSLVSLLFSMTWFGNFVSVIPFLKDVSFPEFAEGATIATIIFDAFKALVAGMERVISTKSLSAFFDMPRDVRFTYESHQILGSCGDMMTIEETEESVAQALCLIDGRLYCDNSNEIERTLSKLREYVLTKNTFLEGQAIRKQPIAAYIAGPPGTGKSTIVSSIHGILDHIDKHKSCPGDVAMFDFWDKYPLGSSANKHLRHLVANDITDNYTQFPTMNLTPLDVAAQKVFDTMPCAFPCPEVDKKGMQIKPASFTFTSNFYTLLCVGEAQKLVRRFEDGILIQIVIVDDEGKELSFSEFSKFPPAERNGMLRFKKLYVKDKHKHLHFGITTEVMTLSEFLPYVSERYLAHLATSKRAFENFADSTKRCACGAMWSYHETVKPGVNGKLWNCFFPDCFEFWCEHMRDIYPQCCGNVDGFDVALLGPDDYVSVYSVLLAFLSCISLYYGFKFMSPIIDVLVSFSKNGLRPTVNALYDEATFMNYQMIDRTIDYANRAAVAYYEATKRKLIARIKNMCRSMAPILLIATGAFSSYKLYNYFSVGKSEELSNPIYSTEVIKASMETTNHRKELNFTPAVLREWNKTPGEMFVADIVEKTTGSLDLCTMAINACEGVAIRDLDNGFITHVRIFSPTPDTILFLRHYIKSYGNNMQIEFADGVCHNFEKSELRFDASTELVGLRIHRPGYFRNMTKYFLGKDFPEGISFDGVVASNVGNAKKPVMSSRTKLPDKFVSTAYKIRHHFARGDCMTPLIGSATGGSFIAGFLFGGENDSRVGTLYEVGCFAPMSRESWNLMWMNDVEPLAFEMIIDKEHVPKLLELSMKSELRNVLNPHLIALGTMDKPNSKFVSGMRRTPLYDEASPKLSKEFSWPKKVSFVKDGTYRSAMINQFSNFGVLSNVSFPKIMDSATDWLVRVVNGIKKMQPDINLSSLLLEEAVFGVEGVYSRIPFKTSNGRVLREKGLKNKYALFETEETFSETDEKIRKYVFNPDVRKEVDEIIRLYADGHIIFHTMDLVEKDEVRTVEKLEKAKVRLFSNLHLPVNLVCRMYLLPLVVAILSYPEITECYGQINAGGIQWHELALRLIRATIKDKAVESMTDEEIIAIVKAICADFSNFDASHKMIMIRVCALVLMMMADKLGYSKESLPVVYFCVLSIAYQLVFYHTDVFLKFGGLPSGSIITLLINSLIVSFLFRMCFKELCPDLRFDDHVALGDVGDDNIAGLSLESSPRYNMETIQPLMRRFGYNMTAADKESEITPFVRFDELSFLKRTFRKSEELNVYVAPIDSDSIYKSLCFENIRSGISTSQRLVDLGASCQREWFLKGKKEFYAFQEWAGKLYFEKGYHFQVLSWEELEKEWRDNTFTTFMI